MQPLFCFLRLMHQGDYTVNAVLKEAGGAQLFCFDITITLKTN